MAGEMTPFHPDYANHLYALHQAGRSLLSLSREFGHQRKIIRGWIERIGGKVRSRSEAMLVRMKNASPEERRKWSSSAHDAVRGMKRSNRELKKRAKAKSKIIGAGETELFDALTIHTLPAEAQRACGRYNIDVSVGTRIAVELCTQGNFKTPRLRDRSKYLRDHGYCIIYVAFKFDRVDCVIGNLDDIITFIKRAYRSPSLRRKDWVIWCRSERFARLRNDLGQLTAVEVPERFFNIISEIDFR